ncbi:MAG: 2-(3-amino-3-carboxypropyl)histidine synthase subunit [Nanoarchaeota archaeon]|nr:2-(3-amino-3-carboxypropyl)histidine synthase subunit [Nanoarchaeota archaeon]
MKVMFIEAKRKINFNLNKFPISKLPKQLCLVYTIQYKDIALKLKNKFKNIKQARQILGCSKLSTKLPIIYIGDGTFHITNLYSQNTEIYTYNLYSNKLKKIPQSEITKHNQKIKGKLSRFYSANSIGIIVSTKKGQYNLKIAEKLKNQIQQQGKKAYIFITNNLNINELENFPNIDFFVNTACPRIQDDSNNIIDYQLVLK